MVAALVAIRRPELVRSSTIISCALQADAWISGPQASGPDRANEHVVPAGRTVAGQKGRPRVFSPDHPAR